MREFLRQFLLFSRAERRAVLALVFLIAIVCIAPRIYRYYLSDEPVKALSSKEFDLEMEPFSHSLDSLEQDTGQAIFFFDPNTLPYESWLKLGLSQKQAAVIGKYLARGGRFRKPEDLARIYVLSDAMKARLISYVRIDPALQKAAEKARHPPKVVEINQADSAAFESLPGIGPSLAGRIIKFRKLLGGFYNTGQIRETYGLRDSTYKRIRPYLKVDPLSVYKLDINQADYESLRRHPYIHAKIAHAIVNQRNKKGFYSQLEELRQLRPVTDSIYRRIVPYLKISE